MSELRCDLCGRSTALAGSAWRCVCGGPFSIVFRGGFDPGAIRSRPYDMWRYREAIAFGPLSDPVSLGEGFTPLLDREVMGVPARFKMESLNPTGSFKDRGASLLVSRLAAMGTRSAMEDSSGNAGLAMAAYGSRAGIRMEILVPDDAPPPKIAAIKACGGTVVRIHGGRQAAAMTALERAESGVVYASHVWNPLFLEGTKTFAFELWEQTDRRPPARIFLPVGNGSLLLGAFAGFSQLVEQGLMDRIPRFHAVQAESCSPLLGDGRAPIDTPIRTLADGIRIPAPARKLRILDAITRSGGTAIPVTEKEIGAAVKALGRTGLDVEPTSAAAYAGARRWFLNDPEAGRCLDLEGPPCVVMTGSGLKVVR